MTAQSRLGAIGWQLSEFFALGACLPQHRTRVSWVQEISYIAGKARWLCSHEQLVSELCVLRRLHASPHAALWSRENSPACRVYGRI